MIDELYEVRVGRHKIIVCSSVAAVRLILKLIEILTKCHSLNSLCVCSSYTSHLYIFCTIRPFHVKITKPNNCQSQGA